MIDDDSELIGRAIAGSEEAFAGLLRRHQAHVRAYLIRFIRQP